MHEHAAVTSGDHQGLVGPGELGADAEGNGAAHRREVGEREVCAGHTHRPVLGEQARCAPESTHSTPSSGKAARSSVTTRAGCIGTASLRVSSS